MLRACDVPVADPLAPLPRVLQAPEGPAEHVRNALALLDLHEKGDVDPALIRAACVRLKTAIDQLEGRA